MTNYISQHFHINEKKDLKSSYQLFILTAPMTFPKTEKIHYSDIKGHSYSYNTEFTNSDCLVKRIQINPLAIQLSEIVEIIEGGVQCF